MTHLLSQLNKLKP